MKSEEKWFVTSLVTIALLGPFSFGLLEYEHEKKTIATNNQPEIAEPREESFEERAIRLGWTQEESDRNWQENMAKAHADKSPLLVAPQGMLLVPRTVAVSRFPIPGSQRFIDSAGRSIYISRPLFGR